MPNNYPKIALSQKMLPYPRFPAFGRPGSGPWRRVLRTMYKIAICNVSIFQHCASARDFDDFNGHFGYGDGISRQNSMIPRNRPGTLQTHFISFPATPNDPQMFSEPSRIDSEMIRNHHFSTRRTGDTTRSLPEFTFGPRSLVLCDSTHLTRLSEAHPMPPISLYQ